MYACMCLSYFHHVQLFAIPWTIAHQVPLSLGFARQEFWNGLPFPSPGDIPDLQIEPGSPTLQDKGLYSQSYNYWFFQ